MTAWRRCIASLVPAVLACAAARNAVCQQPPAAPKLPTLTVQLVVRDGDVGIDRAASSIHLGDHAAVYEGCGLRPEGMKLELIDHLEAATQANGRLLTQLAMRTALPEGTTPAQRRKSVEAILEQRAHAEADTGALWGASLSWAEAAPKVRAWSQAMRSRDPQLIDADRGMDDMFDLVRSNPALADGPLLPAPMDTEGSDRARAGRGLADFEIAPPLVHAAGKLRPTSNVAEWDALRRGLDEAAFKSIECRLWYRERVVAGVQDYLEMRGISLRDYRTADDAKDAQGLVVATDRPDDRAAIRAERPEFRDKDSGGRIHLDPDPLLEAVYIRAETTERALVERVLYLLLPSSDFDRVRASGADYLCKAQAVWMPSVEGQARPSAIQLPLDGAMPALKGQGLAAGRIYMTRRELALRMQRLGAIGYDARIDMAHDVFPKRGSRADANQRRRLAILIVEPSTTASGPSPATTAPALELLDCHTPRDPPDTLLPVCRPGTNAARCVAPLSAAEHADIARPDTQREKEAKTPPRNHLEFSIEHRAGKPARLGASYTHQGIGADDSFSFGVGQQSRPSGDFSYSSDFVGFAALGRRLQLTARGYSRFDPQRSVDPTRPDERRAGVELRGTLDLWRDLGGTFGQAEFGVNRTDIELESAGAAIRRTRVTLADATLVVVRSQAGTPASPYEEAVLSLARGRADGRGFGKAGLELSAHRFVAPFAQWDLRVRAQAVGAQAPVAEYPRFGGEDTVRGYRNERVVARRIWAIQNEYWMPLPWQFGSPALARTLRRNLALAALVDIGGVAAPLTPFGGRKAALGLGLRYNYQDTLSMRLDVARPVGSTASDDRRVRIHFSITARRIL